MHGKHWLVIFLFLTGIIACKKGLIEYSFPGFQQPANFPAPVYHFSTNQVTQAGFELGRKLFYDRRLSQDNSISCGSCHLQTAAFTHPGHAVSHGIHDLLGKRNSPAIMNLAWSTSFMRDGGIADLDLQPIAPITSAVEMGESMAAVLEKIRDDSQYPALFKNAFGNTEISSSNFLKALSQFMLMCISSQSKYDSVRNGDTRFSLDEEEGYTLFKQKCNSCHTEPLFTDYSFRNNGIPPNNRNDEGRYLVTLNEADKYTFKVPTLRNLQYTTPYMHDGRFFTLDAVLDHYVNQVQHTQNLDPLFIYGTTIGIPLDAMEKQQLIIFLKTLNDQNFISNTLLSEQ